MRSRVITFAAALTLFISAVACTDDPGPRRMALPLDTPVFSVGVLHGIREEMFGEIGDVVASPNREFFVLDTQRQEIKRYDSFGMLWESVGRPGSGPGEFRAASDLAVTPDGYLVVLDEATWHLTVYRVKPDGLEYAHKHRLPFLPRQVCQADGRLFVLGLYDSFALHEVTLAGRVRNSFATVPGVVDPAVVGPGQDLLREMYATGQIACLDGPSPLVAYVPETFPVIRAFSADGRVLWQREIDGYREVRRSRDAEGLVRFRPDPEVMRTHHATAFSAIDQSAFVLQLTERDHEREEVVVLQSRLVDATNGRTIVIADNLPRLSESVGGRLYAWRSDPFPRVLVFDLPPLPASSPP